MAGGSIVRIRDFAFAPSNLTVRAGDQVTWIHQDFVQHTTTSDDGFWDSDLLENGQSFAFRFTAAGRYGYFCVVHPFMRGTVEVRGEPATITPSLTATPSPSPGPTFSPTPPPSLTPPPPTPTPGHGLTGRNLVLTYLGARQALLSWQAGSGQPIVLRITHGGVAPIQPLSVTSHTDALPAGAPIICYLVAAGLAGGLEVTSDLLCVVPDAETGLSVRNLTLQLTRLPEARLSWGAAQGATGYILLPIGTQRVQLLPPSGLSAADPTGGAVTCYLVATQSGVALTGTSSVLCGAHGQGPGSTAAL